MYGVALFLIVASAVFALFFTAGYTDSAAAEWAGAVVATLTLDALLIKPVTGALSAVALTWMRVKSPKKASGIGAGHQS
eukprot:gene27596-65606_t